MKRFGWLLGALLLFAAQTNSRIDTTSGATQQIAGIAGIHVVGQPALVFDHLVDKREPNHLPDLPTTAWKEANGTVNVTVPHIENYRMRGPDLEHVVSSPNPIFSSTANASEIVESHYNYHHWLAAPYTFDGLTIYALSHTEWYACLLVGDCADTAPPTPTSTGNYWLNSWANTLNSLVSTDGGASWTINGLNEAHVVSNESFTWTGSAPLAQFIYRVATSHSGMMSPSRIIKEGGYYYSMAFLNHRDFNHIDPTTKVAPIDKYDWVLMRTTDPRQAAGWEGWVSGSQFVPLSSHGFTAFSPPSAGGALNAGEPQIIFDTNANVYIVIFVVWGAPGSIYYVTTPSLANPVWSNAVAIGGSASVQTNPRSADPAAACSTGFQVNNYVSLADTHSDGLNFEFTDGDPWLFYVFNPAQNCGGDNLARDLYRLKLNVDYAAGPRPAFTAQPVNQHVTPGQNPQLIVGTSGAVTYRWQMSTNAGVSWTNLSDVPPYSGAGTPTLLITGATVGQDRTQYRCVATNGAGSAISNTAVLTVGPKAGTDLDGDGKTDLTIWRPSTGIWYVLQSGSNFATASGYLWGVPTDVPVSGDFDGDGKADVAVFRPTTGVWYLLLSSTNFSSFVAYQWGVSSDIPVPGDYDGDGKTDVAIYRPSIGTWWVLQSSTNFTAWASYNWGTSTDVAVAGDYDGDGKTDVAIYRPSTGTWWVLKSNVNFTTWASYNWGTSTDVPVAGDYDGDGKTDVAIYRPSTGGWWLLKSSTNFTTWATYNWGTSTDVPVPGDYDGDGKIDVAIYRPSTGTWWILKSSTNFTTWASYLWGLSTDVPVLKRP
jgi:hypothetical protein